MDERKSYSGMMFMLAGAPVEWGVEKQTRVAKSTTEAEWRALSEATARAQYIRWVMLGAGFELSEPIVIREDNATVERFAHYEKVKLAKQPGLKHVIISGCCVVDAVQNGEVDVLRCDSADNAADVLTKNLGKAKFRAALRMLGMADE